MNTHRPGKGPSKKVLVLGIVIAVLIGIRIILPSFVLKKTNQFLADFSPEYLVHIEDLKLHILRGAYSFHHITGTLKDDKKKFLEIDSVDVSLAWRELFKGELVSDIETAGLKFLVIKDIKKLKPPEKDDRDKAKNKLFPLRIARFDLRDSSLTFEGIESLDNKTHFTISDINGRISNLNPENKETTSFFNLTAKIVDPDATFKAAGSVDFNAKPIQWDLDAEVRNFRLKLMNPYFKKHLPLSFTSGTLDLYSEVQSKDGPVIGYVKPFARELDVVANKENFKSAKHFGFEIISALGNLIFREKKTKSVATKVDFTFDKKLNFNMKKTLSKAIEHGFEQQLSPGIEDKLKLK